MSTSLLEHVLGWWRLIRRLPTLPNRVRNELAELRTLRADISRLSQAVESGRLQESGIGEGPEEPYQRINDALESMTSQLQEHALILETAVRGSQQAEAERQLQAKHPLRTDRSSGLSVLIPCWNHGGLLKQSIVSALDSISELEHPGEIIVLDDASRDESRSIARACAALDARVKLIESDRNLGLARGRNTLLSQARYHHALMLDADNQLLPKGVSALYRSACQTKATLAYGTIVMVDADRNVVGLMSHRHVTSEASSQNWVDAMAIVRTKRLLELGGYEADVLGAICDWELLLRLMRLQESIVHVPTPVGVYRKSSLSMLHDAVDHLRVRRLRRMYAIDGPPREEDIQAAVHHPALGYLWRSDSRHDSAGKVNQSPDGARRPRLLVVASAGVRNHGDDAILLATLQRLKRLRPQADLVVVSDGPDIPPLGRQAWWAGTCHELCTSLEPKAIQQGCQDYPQIAAEVPTVVGATMDAALCPLDLHSIDAIVFSGGGNLATYWPKIVAWRTALAAAARSIDIPYIFTGQGVGPLGDTVSPHVKFLAETSSAFVTRDALSTQLLRSICGRSARVETCGDDALGLSPEDPAVLRQWLTEIGIPDRTPMLGFHARLANYTGLDLTTQVLLAKQIDELAAMLGYAVLCLPINSQSEAPEVELLTSLREASQSRATWYVADASDQPRRVAGLVKLCSAVVTQSFHVALHAMESTIPTLLFAETEYYQRKGLGLNQSFGTPCSINITPNCKAAAMRDRVIRLRNQPWTATPTSDAIEQLLDRTLPSTTQSGHCSTAPQFSVPAGQG